MKVHSIHYDEDDGWQGLPGPLAGATLALLFAARGYEDRPDVWDQLRTSLAASGTDSIIAGCSTAGGILRDEIWENAIVGAIVEFERTSLNWVSSVVADRSESFTVGRSMGQRLATPGLKALFVLSDGLAVNGAELAKGLQSAVPPGVTVSGGLAGDGAAFERTWVLADAESGPKRVVVVGFYGDHVQVACGSQGGWDKFGVERRVTRAEGSVVYELDGKPALTLYKEYLGNRAAELPAAGLLFPLAIRSPSDPDTVIVRTILHVDETALSLSFAGDVPVGSYAQLMKANFERLVEGAATAAEQTLGNSNEPADSLVIAVSCVGRKLVLGSRAEDELDAALAVFPRGASQVGFYSYGELAPRGRAGCQLHNQTMTLTRLYES